MTVRNMKGTNLVKTCIYASFGLLLIAPFFIFVIVVKLPIFGYRILVTKLFAPLFGDGLGKAVNLNGQFMATQFIDTKIGKDSRYTIILNMILPGSLSRNEMIKIILEGWIHSTNPDGSLKYPEFQQYLVNWMGFMFWKQEASFNINDRIHTHMLDPNISHTECYKFQCNLVEELLNKPFIPKRSPWEVHITQNFKTILKDKSCEGTLITIRFHHVLGDGFSLTKAVVEGLFGDQMKRVYDTVLKKAKITMETDTCQVGVLEHISTTFQCLADFGFLLTLFVRRQYPFKHKNSKERNDNGKSQIYARSEQMSMAELKFIKNTLGVSFSSLLQSCVGAALAKYFKENYIERDDIRLYMGLPVGSDRHKLRNQTMGAIFSLATSSHLRPLERLQITDQRFQSAKTSTIPYILHFLTQIFSGSLAYPFSSFVRKCRCFPVGLANFPGPAIKFGLADGRKIVASDAISATYADLVFLVGSYDGYVSITATAEQSVIGRHELNAIVKDVCEEINKLYLIAVQTTIKL